jgi:hypothetical protein
MTKREVDKLLSGPPGKDVLALAKWLHEAARKTNEARSQPYPMPQWAKLTNDSKQHYVAVARLMLGNPPLAIRRAVRRLECLD